MSDSRVGTFWAEMVKKKTFVGGLYFPHLSHLMTTLLVIVYSNVDSERIFSTCRKIDIDPLSHFTAWQ
jgi:hypothetical protein